MNPVAAPPALPAAPGAALPWEPGFTVYKGQANLATGNLTLAHGVTGSKDFGPGVDLTLVFNSQSNRTGVLGARRTHSYEARIVGTSPAILVRGDGREIPYALSGGLYAAPSGFHEKLVKAANGTWTLTYKDGSARRFGTAGQLTSIADANGNATTLSYSGGLLSTISDAVGRSLSLAYSGTKLSSVTDPEGGTWGFSYNSGGNLTSISDPALGGTVSSTAFS